MGWLANQKERNEKIKAEKAEEKEINATKKMEYGTLLKSAGKPYATSICEYLGGHPNISNGSSGNLVVNKLGVFFEKSLPFRSFVILTENIVRAEFKTDTQISKDVTLTRLFALGIFAFGAKKKTKEEHNYLVITYKENGIENSIIFEANKSGVLSSKAGTLASAIMKARQEYMQEHTIANHDQPAQPIVDKISQLERLAELKAKGILSDEEFQAQKEKILSL
ncbi:MAG: SHOCT domain-containing protein [Desulfitobacteriaceae bacterium]